MVEQNRIGQDSRSKTPSDFKHTVRKEDSEWTTNISHCSVVVVTCKARRRHVAVWTPVSATAASLGDLAKDV